MMWPSCRQGVGALMYEVAHSMMCRGVHEIRVGLMRGDRIYESWIR
jgi:hypothetical protein